MIYRLLGELEIGDEGHPADLPGGVTLIILAAFLIRANQQLSKSFLIRVAWGTDDIQEAQLHKRIMAVRDLLAVFGRREDLKTHPRVGYELRAADEDVDALMFNRLLTQANAAREASAEPGAERGLLRQALALWRGAAPLSNVPSDAFHQEVQALQGRRKHAAARLFDLELAQGRHKLILDELSAIAAMYPTDRRLSEQLMLAAYRCGHLTDVASAYERHREALAAETNGLPDPALRAFHFAIACGDEASIMKAESDIARRAGTPAGSPVFVPRQLPRPPELIGRDALVAQASELLSPVPARTVPVVVISGPGGIGKTALALAVAHNCAARFPHGQLYADLRGTADAPTDSAEILAQFLRALGVSQVPESKHERLAVYRTLLAERQVLVVLDDAAGEAQVSDLVPAEPSCAVLVTARRRLPGTGSHHVPTLAPLDAKDARELFVRVASRAGIDLDDDPAAIDRVVTLCGGLPLALRIAGALRARDHPRTTAELAASLDRQGAAALTYEGLNVARTIEAGFDLLGPRERLLFLRLSLLPLPRFGDWTAAALLDDADVADATALLSRLAETFIIEPAGQGVRYRFHDLTHDYARRRALEQFPGDRDGVSARAYRGLLTLARRAHARLYGGDFEVVHSSVPDWDAPAGALAEVDAAPLDWFEKERDNIRVAVDETARLGMSELSWDLAFSAHEFYTVRTYFDDWHATASTALRACQEAGNSYGEAVMLVCLGQPALVASRRGSAAGIARLRRAVGLLAESEDKHGLAIAQRTLASALRRQGHLTSPLALYQDAQRNYEASGDSVGRWQCLRLIGQTFLGLGQHERAGRQLAEAEKAAARFADERLLAQTRYWMGQASLADDDLDRATSAFTYVLGVYQDAGGPGRGYGLHGLGEVARRAGLHEIANQRLGESASLAREGADAVLEGRVWMSFAQLRRAQGQVEGWLGALREARAVFASCDAAHLEARALAELGRALREQGDTVAADAARDQMERLYQQGDVPPEDRVHEYREG